MIRRTASEILHDLESRIARLEGKTAAGGRDLMAIASLLSKTTKRHFPNKILGARQILAALKEYILDETENTLGYADISEVSVSIVGTIVGIHQVGQYGQMGLEFILSVSYAGDTKKFQTFMDVDTLLFSSNPEY